MTTATVHDVAKKITKPVPASESEDAKGKPMIVQVRGSDQFKGWTEELARFDNRSITSLVERALRMYAIQIGFTKEQPQR